MSLCSFFVRDVSTRAKQMDPSGGCDEVTYTGPSPSLWPEPEPAQPIPIAARRVQFNGEPQARASYERRRDAHTDGAASSGYSATPGMDSGSTFPSVSSATTYSSPRRVEATVTNIFEPQYPAWYHYPPILPTVFESRTRIETMKNDFADPTEPFFQQSRAFRDWVKQKNEARIQLRHTPTMEMLVAERHKYQYITHHSFNPTVRADARQALLEIEAEMVEERKKLAAEELQHIRDIEKGWVSFVRLENHEHKTPKQGCEPATLPKKPERSLSKVELLLGSNGSSWATVVQKHPSGLVVGSPDVGRHDAKPATSDSPQKLPALTGASPWPEKQYEILVPDWFPVAESRGFIEIMDGATVKERFKGLLNYIYQLEIERGQQAYQAKHPKKEGAVKNYNWDMYWHSPNPGWTHEHQRRKGGWWKCQKGCKGTATENSCEICPVAEIFEPPPPSQALDSLMKEIRKAMAIVSRDDKKTIMERATKCKPANAGLFRQLDEDVRMWALHQEVPSALTQFGRISLGAREPWINYNPLRGLDTSETTASEQEDMDEFDGTHDDLGGSGENEAGKGKGGEQNPFDSEFTSEDTMEFHP
ncbi:hypothetical protein F4808DRAFT_114999 [Astrocystis sublimbata]|nr:hypothetical protein F4808DRAFT_114999 [Astrocystis sublimbata]